MPIRELERKDWYLPGCRHMIPLAYLWLRRRCPWTIDDAEEKDNGSDSSSNCIVNWMTTTNTTSCVHQASNDFISSGNVFIDSQRKSDNVPFCYLPVNQDVFIDDPHHVLSGWLGWNSIRDRHIQPDQVFLLISLESYQQVQVMRKTTDWRSFFEQKERSKTREVIETVKSGMMMTFVYIDISNGDFVDLLHHGSFERRTIDLMGSTSLSFSLHSPVLLHQTNWIRLTSSSARHEKNTTGDFEMFCRRETCVSW